MNTFSEPVDEATQADSKSHPVLVSVIIPAKNAAETLPDCLQSVAASAYRHLEVIVVSDASSDATDEIAAARGARVVRNETSRGASYARNVGASISSGEVLFFVDADVVLNPDAISIAVEYLQSGRADAVFGSYIAETSVPNFVGKFKNYQHHFNHQIASDRPASFWSGCEAVTRSAFVAIEGFDVSLQFCEDIEFGYALREAGYEVLLLKHMQAEHLKVYYLSRVIKSDLFARAIPWTRLLRSGRSRMGTLNTNRSGVLSVALTAGIWASAALALWNPLVGWGAAAAMVVFLGVNWRFLRFLRSQRGFLFVSASVLLLLLHFTICALGYLGGHLTVRYPRKRTPAPQYAFTEEFKVSRS